MLNVLLERNRIQPEMLEKVAQKLADFHSRAATNPEISSFGKLAAVKVNTDENFSQTLPYVPKIITAGQFNRLKTYTENFFNRQAVLFGRRVDEGRIRDCHGDLHAQHICFADYLHL